MGWLMLASQVVTEEEEGGEQSSTHQAGTEQLQVQAGEHQGTHRGPTTKSQ